MSADYPSINIVIAVYNAVDTIKACLNSCLEQDYPNKKLIVIDGGSTDGTKDVVSANSDRLFYWVSEPDGGIYHAWNKALRVATGDWICFMGADDAWSSSSSLSSLMSLADYPVVNFVCANIRKLSHEGKSEQIFGEPWSYARMKKRMTVAHAGMLHHKSLFEKYGEFDQSYRITGDYEFLLRVGDSIVGAYLPEEVVVMGGGGVSSTNLHTVLHEGRRAISENNKIGPLYGWIFTFKFLVRYAVTLINPILRWPLS